MLEMYGLCQLALSAQRPGRNAQVGRNYPRKCQLQDSYYLQCSEQKERKSTLLCFARLVVVLHRRRKEKREQKQARISSAVSPTRQAHRLERQPAVNYPSEQHMTEKRKKGWLPLKQAQVQVPGPPCAGGHPRSRAVRAATPPLPPIAVRAALPSIAVKSRPQPSNSRNALLLLGLTQSSEEVYKYE